MTKYKQSITDKDIINLDVEGWSREAYDHATTMYKGATENEKLPQSYIDANLPMLEGNITLGGYRLYALISYIYTDTVLHSEESDSANKCWANTLNGWILYDNGPCNTNTDCVNKCDCQAQCSPTKPTSTAFL